MINTSLSEGSFGQAKKEIKKQNTITFPEGMAMPGVRYYDSELGRWLSADPLADSYPEWSPYSYAGNKPINAIDINGMKWVFLIGYGRVWELPEIIITAERPPWWEEGINERFDRFNAESQYLDYKNYQVITGTPFSGLEKTTELLLSGIESLTGLKIPDPVKDILMMGLTPGVKFGFGIIGGVGKSAKGISNLTIRSDVVLSGGRSGQLVKGLTGPANSVLKGSPGRIYITDDAGRVIWDITKARAKPVIPGQGFGSKVAPTQEQLNLIKQLWGQ